jgi:hypothetical protein
MSSSTTHAIIVLSYNILAQGFTDPFIYSSNDALEWSARRGRILAAITSPSPPDIVCLQELQSSTRGWGRALAGADLAGGPDHALELRGLLAAVGYEGAYAVNEDDPRSSKSSAKNDRAWAAKGCAPKDRNLAWPVVMDAGPGGRLGVALFWRRDVFELLGERRVSMSAHFFDRTKGVGNDTAWHALSSWNMALVALLKHKASGGIVAVACLHLPTPGATDDPSGAAAPTAGAPPTPVAGAGGDDATPAPAPVAPARASVGVVQQVQFCEALCAEVASLLGALGLLQRVPVIFAGDFNAMPGSPAIRLLKRGSLDPSTEPALSGFLLDKGSGGGAGKAEKPPIVLPYPAPSCAGLGAFTSAYESATGEEPPFTNHRLVRPFQPQPAPSSAAPPPSTPAFEEPRVQAPVDAAATLFSACLDYILLRNPAAVGSGSGGGEGGLATDDRPPVTRLAVVGVRPIPTREEASAQAGGLPSTLHPSDHVPIGATLALTVTG